MEKGQIFNNPLMGLSCFTTTTATTTLPSSDQKGQNRKKTSYFHEIKTPLIHRIKNFKKKKEKKNQRIQFHGNIRTNHVWDVQIQMR